jgi:hypothetical protein
MNVQCCQGAEISAAKHKKDKQIVCGLTRGSPPFYITNAGGEPQVNLGVWRPEMLALTTGQSPPHAVINTVYALSKKYGFFYGIDCVRHK